MRPRISILWLAVVAASVGCSSSLKEETKIPPPAAPVVEEKVDPRPVVVALGDSLTAGYGVEPGLSYPDWLQKRMDGEGAGYRVVNQGISGDTTSGGVARIEEALRLKPAVVVLALGANDGLRGLPLETTRANLAEMIDRLQAGGARVLLGGMTLPRNYGPDYVRDFENVFKELAKEKKTGLIPFLLEGVAMNPQLMQGDALHPTAEGNRRVAETVWKYLRPMLPPAGAQ